MRRPFKVIQKFADRRGCKHRSSGLRWRSQRGEKGSVLLLVLITIMFTAFAVSKFVERSGIELLAEARAIDHERLRVEAYSALETTLAVLQEFKTVNSTLRTPSEGWSDPLTFARYVPAEGLKVTVGFQDESGKLSLPRADMITLQKLFESFGLDKTNYEKLTDAFLSSIQTCYTAVGCLAVRADYYS